MHGQGAVHSTQAGEVEGLTQVGSKENILPQGRVVPGRSSIAESLE